jgi:hypothetical protein
LFELIAHLLDWDMSLENISYRSENVTDLYRQFFIHKLIPVVLEMIESRKQNKLFLPTNSSTTQSSLLMIAPNLAISNNLSRNQNSNVNASIAPLSKKNNKAFQHLLKVVCYVFLCVPSQALIKMNLLPQLLDFLFEHMNSPKLNSEVK